MSELTLSKALGSGLRRALADDDRVVLMGEDIGTLGGVFRVTDGLQAEFGTDRVMDMPLAESGIIGMAVGRPLLGLTIGVATAFGYCRLKLGKHPGIAKHASYWIAGTPSPKELPASHLRELNG